MAAMTTYGRNGIRNDVLCGKEKDGEKMKAARMSKIAYLYIPGSLWLPLSSNDGEAMKKEVEK